MQPEPGWEAPQLLAWMVAQTPAVEALDFLSIDPAPSVMGRIRQDTQTYHLVAESRPKTHLWFPRHEAVLSDAIEQRAMQAEAWNLVVWHDETGSDIERMRVPRTEITQAAMAERAGARPERIFGFSSRAYGANGELGFFPMMDFQCPADRPGFATAIINGLRAIGETRGTLLTSGNSFHYQGFDLRPAHEWRPFMGSACCSRL